MSGKRAKKARRADQQDDSSNAHRAAARTPAKTSRVAQLKSRLPGLLEPASEIDMRARHAQCAASAVGRGVVFERMQPADRVAVETLVRLRVANQQDYSMASTTGGIVGRVDGVVVGAMVCAAATFRGKNPPSALHIQDLVVDQAWEGQGIGTVLLGMRHQLVDLLRIDKPVFIFGGCEPGAAHFYSSAGFFVLPPGTPLPHPGMGLMHMPPDQTVYTSWFMDVAAAKGN